MGPPRWAHGWVLVCVKLCERTPWDHQVGLWLVFVTFFAINVPRQYFKSGGGAPCVLYALWLLGSRKALAAWRSRAVVWSVLNKKDNINAAYNQSSDTSTRHVYRPRGGDGSQVPGDRSC